MIQILSPKDPDVAATYAINWLNELVTDVQRETTYALDAIVRAEIDTGFYYKCTAAGRTSAYYPEQWPIIEDGTLQDGSVEWTAQHPDDVSVPTVAGAVWVVPTGITKDSQAQDARITQIVLSGGTAGQNYDIVCTMTASDAREFEQTLRIRVQNQ